MSGRLERLEDARAAVAPAQANNNPQQKSESAERTEVQVKQHGHIDNNETQAQSMATSVAVPTSVAKSRLTTQKHKELADLVKQNMERNHVNKPALR